jgi:hypothetical protein
MSKYRICFTQINYGECDIEAESEKEARNIFDNGWFEYTSSDYANLETGQIDITNVVKESDG